MLPASLARTKFLLTFAVPALPSEADRGEGGTGLLAALSGAPARAPLLPLQTKRPGPQLCVTLVRALRLAPAGTVSWKQ